MTFRGFSQKYPGCIRGGGGGDRDPGADRELGLFLVLDPDLGVGQYLTPGQRFSEIVGAAGRRHEGAVAVYGKGTDQAADRV